MIDESYIELMHKEIDGLIEAEERNELHEYISGNEEAKNLYSELTQTANLLKDVPVVSPPQKLKAQIMESLDWSRYQEKTTRPDLVSILSNLFFRPQYKLAYVFAIGIVVGVFLYAFLFSTINLQKPLDNADLYGTIGLQVSKDLKDLQHIPIELNEINGGIHLRQFKNFIVFDVNLKSKTSFNLSLEYEPQSYKFRGFQRDDDNKVALKEEINSIEISTSEDARYLVFFNKLNEKATPIDLRIQRAGQTLSHQSIYINTF
jgi:hypothetical protein